MCFVSKKGVSCLKYLLMPHLDFITFNPKSAITILFRDGITMKSVDCSISEKCCLHNNPFAVPGTDIKNESYSLISQELPCITSGC